MALFKAAHTGSLCTGSNWAPTGLVQGSEYASKLNASYKTKHSIIAKILYKLS
jgi:hypothetical protein